VLIHAQLVGEGCYSPLPQLYEHEWQELTSLVHRFDVARDKGWLIAAESLVTSLELSAANLSRRMEYFRQGLPKNPSAQQILSPREIVADILALSNEFEEVELDLKEKQLAVVTLPIELQDVYLGPFRITLNWEEIGNAHSYSVLAEDPHPADSNEDVTHPHVNAGDLCEGDGATAIRKALTQGRLLDFFILVRQVLQTYNPGSPYVSLSRWNGGVDCSDCGHSMDEEDSYGCNRCGGSVCGECQHTCSACDEWICGGCSLPCHDCEETFCRSCLKPHPQTRVLLCPSCFNKGEDLDDEDETPAEDSPGESPPAGEPGSPTPAGHSLCLAEATVPA